MTVSLRRASVADIPFIMATERRPGYDKVLGRFEEDEHTRLIADPAWAYLVDEGCGIALLNELDDYQANVCLKRFAVTEQSRGLGTRLLPAVIDWTFTHTEAYRLWLRLVQGNTLAERLYLGHGFVREGVQRQAGLAPDGSRFDFISMSILRPEWAARVGRN